MIFTLKFLQMKLKITKQITILIMLLLLQIAVKAQTTTVNQLL